LQRIHGREVAASLEEVADATHSCLVVIDMQNDLCHPDGVLSRRGADTSAYQQMAPRLAQLIRHARSAGAHIVFVRIATRRDNATQSAPQLFFEQRILSQFTDDTDAFEYCVEGTWGYEILTTLDHQPGDFTVDKCRSSAFVGTPLDLYLRSNNIKTVIATGCTTEGCVDSTVREAGFLDYYTVVVEDCVASDVPALHEAAMRILRAYRALVVPSSDLIAAWTSHP
jgi:nicotinamidase-related amidase